MQGIIAMPKEVYWRQREDWNYNDIATDYFTGSNNRFSEIHSKLDPPFFKFEKPDKEEPSEEIDNTGSFGGLSFFEFYKLPFKRMGNQIFDGELTTLFGCKEYKPGNDGSGTDGLFLPGIEFILIGSSLENRPNANIGIEELIGMYPDSWKIANLGEINTKNYTQITQEGLICGSRRKTFPNSRLLIPEKIVKIGQEKLGLELPNYN